jgi:hypothetical protein
MKSELRGRQPSSRTANEMKSEAVRESKPCGPRPDASDGRLHLRDGGPVGAWASSTVGQPPVVIPTMETFLAGPPGSMPADSLAQYSNRLARHLPIQLTEQLLVDAGVNKIFHRKRILKWTGKLTNANDKDNAPPAPAAAAATPPSPSPSPTSAPDPVVSMSCTDKERLVEEVHNLDRARMTEVMSMIHALEMDYLLPLDPALGPEQIDLRVLKDSTMLRLRVFVDECNGGRDPKAAATKALNGEKAPPPQQQAVKQIHGFRDLDPDSPRPIWLPQRHLLLSMGFESAAVDNALEMSSGNVEFAISLLSGDYGYGGPAADAVESGSMGGGSARERPEMPKDVDAGFFIKQRQLHAEFLSSQAAGGGGLSTTLADAAVPNNDSAGGYCGRSTGGSYSSTRGSSSYAASASEGRYCAGYAAAFSTMNPDDPYVDSAVNDAPTASLAGGTDLNEANVSREWNCEYVGILETQVVTEHDYNAKRRRLHRFLGEFEQYVKIIATTLIAERHLPSSEKSIKASDLGGIAGGEKYLFNGVVFKFAVDDKGIYGADWLAAKAARNEIRACTALLESHVDGLTVPLTAAIEAYGLLCICAARLPIDATTLVLGSADGCRTVRDGDAGASSTMAQIGQALGTKEHRIVGLIDSSESSTAVGADVELHRGSDGRLYCIDLARVLPPARVSAHNDMCPRSWPLVQQLRPEWTAAEAARTATAFNSDAFMGFGAASADIIGDEDALTATSARQLAVAVPEFAARLPKMVESDGMCVAAGDLSVAMHKAGLNVRHLGAIYNAMTSNAVNTCERARVHVVLCEIVCRCAKHHLKILMQDVGTSSAVGSRQALHLRHAARKLPK